MPVKDHDTEVAAIEAAVVAIRRSRRRRNLSRLASARGRRTGEVGALPDGVFELLDAVEEEPLTVTAAAARLDVDQPRASRLSALAIEAGLLARAADQADGRRSLLVLTPAGVDALGQIRRFRRQVIAEATAGWSDRDIAALARLLPRFVADFTALTVADPGGRR